MKNKNILSILILMTIVPVGFVVLCSFMEPSWIRTILLISSIVLFFIDLVVDICFEIKTGHYKCTACGAEFKLDGKSVFTIGIGTTRYLTCPVCGERHWLHKDWEDEDTSTNK